MAVTASVEIVDATGDRDWLESVSLECEACEQSWSLYRPVAVADADAPFPGDLPIDDDLQITPDEAIALDLHMLANTWGDDLD